MGGDPAIRCARLRVGQIEARSSGSPALLHRIRPLRSLTLTLSLIGLFVGEVSAETAPYSLSVERFAIPERGIFDDFDDGVLDSAWDGTVYGTAVESGSTLTLSSPGATGFLLPFAETETSVVSGQGVGANFSGDFTATSVWSQVVPDPTLGLNLAFGSIDPNTGHVHQLSVGLGHATSEVAAALGGDAGLAIGVLSVVRDNAPGDILSLTRTSIPVQASEVTGEIHLSLVFDDAADTLTPMFSLDGGVTMQVAGAALPWAFTGGGFSLSASSTVPEPGTALLLGLGLVTLGAPRRGAHPGGLHRRS